MLADRCRAEGCERKRIGSSDLCAEHLNEKLARDREARERMRKLGGGNWAAWQTPETPSHALGRPDGEAPEGARGRGPSAGENRPAGVPHTLKQLRDEVARRLDAELAGVEWPLLGGSISAGALKRFEKAIQWLPPEQEVEAWRALHSFLEKGYLDRERWQAALRGLGRTALESAALLLKALEGARWLRNAGEPVRAAGLAVGEERCGEAGPTGDETAEAIAPKGAGAEPAPGAHAPRAAAEDLARAALDAARSLAATAVGGVRAALGEVEKALGPPPGSRGRAEQPPGGPYSWADWAALGSTALSAAREALSTLCEFARQSAAKSAAGLLVALARGAVARALGALRGTFPVGPPPEAAESTRGREGGARALVSWLEGVLSALDQALSGGSRPPPS